MNEIKPIFDYYNLPEIPTFTLCNPDFRELYTLGGIVERKASLKYSDISTLSFKAYKMVDEEEMPYYDYIVNRRLIGINSGSTVLGYYVITDVREEQDGLVSYKDVTCLSLESQLISKKVVQFYGQYLFYDYNGYKEESDSLMEIIIRDYCPDWSFEMIPNGIIQDKLQDRVGFSSEKLWEKRRSFDVADVSLYSFLTIDVAQAYNTIFSFNYSSKTIYAFWKEYFDISIDADTFSDLYGEILISYDTLLKNIKTTEITDNMATCLSVYGGNGLTIRTVNPLGTNKIYNFDYYKTEDWMSPDMISLLDTWEDEIENNRETYEDLVSSLSTQYGIKADAESRLASANISLSELMVELDALQEAGQDTSDILVQISFIQNVSIVLAQSALDNAEEQIETISNQMTAINDLLDLEYNLGEENFLALQPFIIESSYTNENYSIVEGWSGSSIIGESSLLYNEAIYQLEVMSQPKYTFEIDSVNFYMIEELKDMAENLSLGDLVSIEISEDRYITAFFLEYDLNFDDPLDFKMILGNRRKLDDQSFLYSDIMSEVISSSRKTRMNSMTWNNASNIAGSSIQIGTDINTSSNRLVSNSGSSVLDQSGFRGLEVNADLTSQKQIWINKSIKYTDDGWSSPKTALGIVNLDSPPYVIPDSVDGKLTGAPTGLLGANIVGHIIAGDNLLVTNNSGSFILSGSAIEIEIKMDNGHNTIYINSASGISIYKDGSPIFYLDSSGNLHITHS